MYCINLFSHLNQSNELNKGIHMKVLISLFKNVIAPMMYQKQLFKMLIIFASQPLESSSHNGQTNPDYVCVGHYLDGTLNFSYTWI